MLCSGCVVIRGSRTSLHCQFFLPLGKRTFFNVQKKAGSGNWLLGYGDSPCQCFYVRILNFAVFIIQEGCSDALEWYKSVKDTQGSVEVTSFGKLRHILTYGHFHIGSQSSRAMQSIHEIIHLKLQRTDKPLPKMSYSLDDLRDLESKLVLITGSKSKNRKEVDQFLNVSILSVPLCFHISTLDYFLFPCRLYIVCVE